MVDRNADAATHHPLPPPPAEEGSHFQSSEESRSARGRLGALGSLPGNAGLRFSGPWFYPGRAADLKGEGLRYSRYQDEEPRASSTRIPIL